ncbi:MAG: DUF362 domain-containing protein [Deltaproteobacteria bacterium]|nr:DUF362 domain-containing protein [Deltaproteobacteria bacterium]
MNPDPDNNDLNRRQFLARAAKAGVSIAAAGAAGFWFHDSRGPGRSKEIETDIHLPDYSISGLGPRMSIVRGRNRVDTLRLALKSIGGIESFINKGDRVLLKVNAAFASPQMLSATTHPQIVSGMTRLCFDAGASSVIVTDNPINDPNSCFALSGIADAARRAGAQLFLPRNDAFKPLSVPDGKLIRNWPVLYDPLKRINKVIGTAPVKDHHRSGASMIMKNWYGLLGGRRNIFHQDIQTIITELAMMIRPTLVILDGTTTMMTNGPTGGSLSDLKETNTMIAGTDQVAVDAFGATLLGKSLNDLPFIGMAEAAGLGTADYQSLNPESGIVD